MKQQQITVSIDAGGQTTVTVEGVSGPACEKITRDLEASLGAVVERKRTAEFYQRPSQTSTRRRQGR